MATLRGIRSTILESGLKHKRIGQFLNGTSRDPKNYAWIGYSAQRFLVALVDRLLFTRIIEIKVFLTDL